MKLCEHPEFSQAVLGAAAHFRDRGLRPAVIEKDYYLTEALRAVHAHAGTRVIFKGGTSLSKGWNLIERFSEDVDLFLDPEAWNPRLDERQSQRELKSLRDQVGKVVGLRHDPQHSRSGTFGRSDSFTYQRQFDGPGEVANHVLLEVGTASGREPTEERPIDSLLAQFLRETGVALEAEDEAFFPMRLLHFRRTFVEKLFAIHSKVALYLERPDRGFGSYPRHYYDLACLAKRPEVTQMLASPEYETIRRDYDRISRQHYARDYRPPPELRFRASEALFPTGGLADVLEREYERQCSVLCFRKYPPWAEVLQRLQGLKALL